MPFYYFVPDFYLRQNKSRFNNYKNIRPTHYTNETETTFDFFNLGDKAPDFTLTGIVDNEPQQVSLSDYLGKWVLLFFYGSNFTFV